MIDKLKKIAELAPELLGYLNIRMDNLEAWLDTPDRQWMLIGRLVESLVNQGVQVNLSTYHDVATGKLRNDAIIDSYFDHTHHEAPTPLEAVCDAWLSLKGGE